MALSVTLFPEAGPLASLLFLAFGSAVFILQRSTEPKVQPVSRGGDGSAIRLRPVQVIAFALVAVGAIFGTAEVTVIALAEAFGQPAAASFVLGGYAAGSFFVGLVFGALSPAAPLARQFAAAVAVTATTTLVLPFVGSVPALALFVSGVAISPTFITAFGLIEQLVPAAKLTEGITWAWTGIGIGIGMAAGSAASGSVIDRFGAGAGFWVSVAAGAVAVATALFGQRVLRTPRSGSLEQVPITPVHSLRR